MDVSLVALRSLIEVAQRGTMTAAAEALGYTPGAISQHIASLSRSCGRPVVSQAHRGVQLTDAGRVMLDHALRVVESETLAATALADSAARAQGTLRIGAFESSAVLLGAVIAALRPTFPELTLQVHEIHETSTANPSFAVTRSDVDVALGLDYPDAPIERRDDVVYEVLAEERFGVTGLAPGEGGRTVSLGDLRQLGWVIPPPESNFGLAIRAACRRAGFEPRVSHLVTDTAMTLELAAAGAGITLTTPLMQRFAGRAVEQRELEQPITREIHLITSARRQSSAAVEVFAEAVRSEIRALEDVGTESP